MSTTTESTNDQISGQEGEEKGKEYIFRTQLTLL
jgi:hypothetical protein